MSESTITIDLDYPAEKLARIEEVLSSAGQTLEEAIIVFLDWLFMGGNLKDLSAIQGDTEGR